MKTKMIVSLAFASVLAALPVSAQNVRLTALQKAASELATGDIGKAWPVGFKVASVNAKADPWKPVTQMEMIAMSGARRTYQLATAVDYNADGIVDRAYIANNSRQGAVLVQLGGNKGTVIAYKANNKLLGGQEIAAAGKRRLVLQFPESNVLVLSSESGRPSVYYIGD